jgi:hypothetical protein
MILLGVGQRAEHGKSSFCKTIIEHCDRTGFKCGEYSISDSIIKYAVETGLLPEGIIRGECSDEQVAVLVKLGNEKRRGNEDFWVDQIHTAIDRDQPKVALIPNVRFPSEADFVKSLGGWNVRVTRLNANGSRFISSSRNPNDETETSLEFWNWDFEILNMDGRPYWLRRQAIGLFEYLKDGAE